MQQLACSNKAVMLLTLSFAIAIHTPHLGPVEIVTHRNVAFTIWDVGGCDKIRPLWRHVRWGTLTHWGMQSCCSRTRC